MQQKPEATLDEQFGKAMARFREAGKLTQRGFAEELTKRGLSLDASAISRIEQGKRSVRLAEAVTIADSLNVDLDMMMGEARTPGSDLRTARRIANQAMRELTQPAMDFLDSYLWVRELLERHPELAESIQDREVGVLESPAGYFDWVKRRMERMGEADEDEPAKRNFVWASESQLVDQVMDLLQHYIRTQVDAHRRRRAVD